MHEEKHPQSYSVQMKNICKNRTIYFIDIYIILSASDFACDSQGNIK